MICRLGKHRHRQHLHYHNNNHNLLRLSKTSSFTHLLKLNPLSFLWRGRKGTGSFTASLFRNLKIYVSCVVVVYVCVKVVVLLSVLLWREIASNLILVCWFYHNKVKIYQWLLELVLVLLQVCSVVWALVRLEPVSHRNWISFNLSLGCNKFQW